MERFQRTIGRALAPRRRASKRISAAAAGFLGLCLGMTATACGDPTRDDAITALGDERPGVPEGPLHRGGQACLLCHNGAEATAFSVAGTIYKLADTEEPVGGALVHLLDSTGRSHLAATNCAGNFFIRPGDFEPAYPLWVTIEREGALQEMESPINGEGSCAYCHWSLPGPRSAGRVYLLPFQAPLAEADCR